MADVLYDRALVPALQETLQRLAEAQPEVQVIVCQQRRKGLEGCLDAFAASMSKCGWSPLAFSKGAPRAL